MSCDSEDDANERAKVMCRRMNAMNYSVAEDYLSKSAGVSLKSAA
jgi:hypothetical protein